jgi:hypothetical protein
MTTTSLLATTGGCGLGGDEEIRKERGAAFKPLS